MLYDMHDIMNILVTVLIFGALSTYDKYADGYYIVNFVFGPYTMKYETIIDRQNIMSGKRV